MKIEVFDLGLAPYKQTWDFQKTVFARVKNGEIEGGLILCSHLPVITLGRLAKDKNILLDACQLSRKKIELFRIERGGDVTYHGPGQLTVYPIFNLKYLKKDIHWFLRYLENITVEFLSSFGVKAEVRPGLTGAWIGEKKIVSIGIAIRNWISFHGLSINIAKSGLENFRYIRPCGMDVQMTCMEQEAKQLPKIHFLKSAFIKFTLQNLQNKL